MNINKFNQMVPRCVGVLMIVAASRLFAIEDLRISVEGTNVVLNWPSTNGETYVVQFRPSLDVSTPWTTLTNNMPPASGTNRTKYVVVGAVPPSPQSSTQSATTDSTSPAGSPDTGWLASIARRHIDYPPTAWCEADCTLSDWRKTASLRARCRCNLNWESTLR